MEKNRFLGKFIVFEGLDGSGNSTQADLLVKNMLAMGLKAELTKEPTSFLIGGLIRSALAHDWNPSLECLQLLFSADRAHHLVKQITKLLEKGVHVVSDRYFLSTVAYGLLEIDDEDWLLSLNQRFLLPDATFLIKVAPAVCVKRMREGRYDFELFETEEKLAKVWKNYERLVHKFSNVKIIDGERDKETISREIWSLVSPLVVR